MQATKSNPTKILRMKQVVERTGICRAMVYRLQRLGQFPQSIKLSERATGWLEHDVDAWIESRISQTPAVR